MDFLKITTSNINTSYRTAMSISDLEQFMLTGKIQPGFEGQVMHLIDETQTSLIEDAVAQLAAKKNVDARLIWGNLALVAVEIMSPNPYWSEKSQATSLMDVDMAQVLQDGLNKADEIGAAEAKRQEEAKGSAPVTISK